MTSHDAFISGTSRVLIVASLQRFKMEALIPAATNCEVRSVIKFLRNKRRGILGAEVVLLHDNARPHTVLGSTHLLHEFSWEVFSHPPFIPDLAPSDFHIFLLSRNSCPVSVGVLRMTKRQRWVSQWFQSQAATSTTQAYKSWSHGLTNVSVLEVNIWKNSSIHNKYIMCDVYLVVPIICNWKPLLLFLRRPASARYGHFQVWWQWRLCVHTMHVVVRCCATTKTRFKLPFFPKIEILIVFSLA